MKKDLMKLMILKNKKGLYCFSAGLIIIVILIVVITIHKADIFYECYKISKLHTTDKISILMEQAVIQATDNMFKIDIEQKDTYENETEDSVVVSILGKEILKVEKSRIKDDVYGEFLDNQWELEEINAILMAIKGRWEVDQYMGFVPQTLYDSHLFSEESSAIISQKEVEELREDYRVAVEWAQNNIPNVTFSVKENWFGEDTNSNYIYVNGNMCPVNIILSVDRMNEYYPAMVDRTTYADEFIAEYPVLYIQFYMWENEIQGYGKATLVITDDNRFYFLKDGAFYSVRKV